MYLNHFMGNKHSFIHSNGLTVKAWEKATQERGKEKATGTLLLVGNSLQSTCACLPYVEVWSKEGDTFDMWPAKEFAEGCGYV